MLSLSLPILSIIQYSDRRVNLFSTPLDGQAQWKEIPRTKDPRICAPYAPKREAFMQVRSPYRTHFTGRGCLMWENSLLPQRRP